jgi:Fe-S oxidoreductase/anaerobic glycerol-3-phosphate dehydrogenase
MRVDVLVVGSGASGAGAALAAARAGARVALVRRGYSGTTMASGAVRLDLPLPHAARRTREELEALITGVLPLVRVGDRSELLTALGRVVEADLVFPTMERGTLDRLRGKRVAVVQLEGLIEVRARPVVRAARQLGIDADEVRLPFPEAAHRRDLSTPELARLCDDIDPANALGEALAQATGGFDLVALPPVAGLNRWEEVRGMLDRALGPRWFELVAALPSVPGMRIQQALDAALARAGVTVVHGPVRAWATQGDTVVAVRTGLGDGERTIETNQLVLATGGLVGRGLHLSGGRFRERILDLHVDRTGAEPDGDSPGVPVDDDLFPITPEGRRSFSNVRAAGELTGITFGSGRGGLATSLAAGWAAGLKAVGGRGPFLEKVSSPEPPPPKTSTDSSAPDFSAASSPEGQWHDLSNVEGDPLGCLNCGLCLSRCPTVHALSREPDTYPGPRSVMTGLVRFETELGDVAEEISHCTLCGACSAVCPAAVPVPENVTRARAIIGRTAPDAWPQAYQALRNAFDRPRPLFEAAPLDGPRLDRAEHVLFVGCSLPYYERDHAEGTIKLLQALGVGFTLIDEVCCGGPLEVIGASGAIELAAHNLAEVRRVGARRIVTCCPRCAETMSTLEPYRGLEVEHTTTLLARLLPGTEVATRLREKLNGQRATFHDPCERARLAGEVEAARTVMREVGIDLVELPRSGTFTDCCGAGGGVRAAQTKTSLRMARLRVADAVETGAPLLLTECPSCLHNLFNGRKRKQKIEISNLSSFLGSRL